MYFFYLDHSCFSWKSVREISECCNTLWKPGILMEFCSKSVWEFSNFPTNLAIRATVQGMGPDKSCTLNFEPGRTF